MPRMPLPHQLDEGASNRAGLSDRPALPVFAVKHIVPKEDAVPGVFSLPTTRSMG